ncbi:T9SS type B sorting domain-containing protein [Taibaiella lutea]|uniref:T9SS type B sorting domain-containing protein n=1 Tax=Taibaiella lutea TaxID=2608001 RepID=UPI00167FDF23|nr:gliding motility-associated C-terminal domain-containing protein [Taibaiella lutea]
MRSISNEQLNFKTFTGSNKVLLSLYEKYNSKVFYNHPDFGVLPQGAPSPDCVEILEKRKADERAFVDLKDPKSIYIQKSVGDINYRKDGKWIAIDDRLKQTANGVFRSDYYIQPLEINTKEKRTYIETSQGRIYFNQWKLIALTAQGEKLLDAPDWTHYTAGDDGVYITNFFKGIDAELHVYRGTIKTSFIVKNNEYGTYDKLIFRDSYQNEHPVNIAFAGNKDMKTGVGALEVISGNDAVLKIYEAILYPQNNPKNNITTASYSLHGSSMDIEVPASWINNNISASPLVVDPVVTGTATLIQGNILGSMYNAGCTFTNSCDYNLNVSIPAAGTVTSVAFSFTYNAITPCFGSDGGVKLTSGSCATPIFTNTSATPGPTIFPNVPITNDIQGCIPTPSCTAQTMPFTLHFYRSCKGPAACDNTCISAASPWIMTVKAKTVDFTDPTDPINYTSNNICVGDNIYVNTFAAYGVGPYSYNWSFNPTGTPSLGSGSSTSITFPNIVNNTIFAIITDACGNSVMDSLPITVNYASVIATPSSDTICNGESTAISLAGATPGNTFTWTATAAGVSGASNGSGNLIAQTLTATGNTPGTVTYTITPQNVGCIGNPVNVTVAVFPPVTVTKDTFVCVNNLPFVWNGQSFMSGGNALASFTTPSLITGCDSTTILNLSVNPTLSATQNLTICAGQLPYHWNGHILTAGGTHVDSFTNNSFQFHCDSTTYLNLNVVNTLKDTITVVKCQNQLPYLWNGITVNAGGNVAAVYNTTSLATGCDSIAVLRLIVNPLPNVTVNKQICPNQLPYHWNGQTYTASGTGTYVTPSLITGCDSTTTLHLTVNPFIYASQNITICASALPYHWNGQTITTGGVAVSTYTKPSAVTGCDSITTLNLTVNPLITATKTVTICANLLPYHWNGFTISAGGNAVATFTTPSTITGCDSTTTLNLIVNPLINTTKTITICATQLPYMWNGNVITAGGNGVSTFTSPSSLTGCDSTTTLNLIVKPTITATVNATTCANAMPYIWNGITVNAGGATAATFTTTSLVTSCDSITTLNLTVKPIITANKTITICASQLPYTWNGMTINAGGIAVATFTATSFVTGCDSVTTLNLNINPLITATKTITICNSQLPYHWNGYTINAGGLAVATYTTSSLVTGCDSTTTLNLNVNPSINVNQSITKCANQVPFTWNGITINAAGTNVATYTAQSSVTGCDSTTHLNLTVNPVITATKNMNICSMQLPLTWNGIVVTAGGNGVATFTTPSFVTGCDSITTLNLMVTAALVDTIHMTKCANQMPFVWNGITITTAGNNAANFYSPGSNGCDSVTTLSLVVKPVAHTTTDTSICFGQSPFHWNGQNYSASGTYTYTTNAANLCDSIVTLHLNISGAPVHLPNKDSIGCGSVSYKGNIYSNNTTLSDTLFNQNGCDSAYQAVNIVVNHSFNDTITASVCANQTYTWNGQTYNQTGKYSHHFNTTGGCDSLATLDLTVWPLTQVAIQNDLQDIPCSDDTIHLYASGVNAYLWQMNDLNIGSDANMDIVVSLPSNVIKVTGTDANGCESKATVTIETRPCCDMFLPNAFSPNGDGVNDKFGVETIGNPLNFEMRIYNRFGQLLYTGNSISDKWDGTFNGKPVDMGTYYFKVYSKCTNNTENHYKGDITLIR